MYKKNISCREVHVTGNSSTWSVQLLTSRRDTIPPTGSTLRRHLIHLSPSAIAHPSVPNHIASPPARISVKGSKMTSRIPNPSSTNAPRLSTAPSSIKPRQLVCLPPLFPLPWLFFSPSPPRHSLPQDTPPATAMEAVLSPLTPNHAHPLQIISQSPNTPQTRKSSSLTPCSPISTPN
jgi:hypothetical protein